MAEIRVYLQTNWKMKVVWSARRDPAGKAGRSRFFPEATDRSAQNHVKTEALPQSLLQLEMKIEKSDAAPPEKPEYSEYTNLHKLKHTLHVSGAFDESYSVLQTAASEMTERKEVEVIHIHGSQVLVEKRYACSGQANTFSFCFNCGYGAQGPGRDEPEDSASSSASSGDTEPSSLGSEEAAISDTKVR